MEQKLGLSRSDVDPVNRDLQRGHHVGVGGFVEAHVAVADLNEAELTSRGSRSKSGGIAETVGPQNTPLHDEQSSRAGPSHALQESATVNSVVVMIVKNAIFLLSSHR